MNTLKQRYQKIKQEVQQLSEQFNHKQSALLLAVSKRHPTEKIRELFSYGQHCFGENYLQEALEKIEELSDLNIEWHFIGPIQSNKTKAIAENFNWVHSVDRTKIATRLNNHLEGTGKQLNICLQINLNKEPQKSGFLIEDILQQFPQLLKLNHLNIRGLMAIPEHTDDPIKQAENFRLLKQMLDKLNQQFDLNMDTLSMGMSGDMTAAIQEGSTIIRIGTAIFGAREH
ncbi:MAG: YggS family pyridoxal phosphate-dependent enzyme [Gammaproteobacteria bacterium]|nr:YggS family pyridoxal phosphate-dependent enzyme [Gammaproteobacteria bacterium]